MKLKKLAALLMASVMTMSLIGCSGTNTKEATDGSNADTTESVSEDGTESSTSGDQKLVVWTLAADLEQFSEHYMEKNPGVEIETVVIAPADYPTKIQTALLGGNQNQILLLENLKC